VGMLGGARKDARKKENYLKNQPKNLFDKKVEQNFDVFLLVK
jgi:hypothetical protein